MRAIRQILLTEYIGAILVAVLVADAFSAIITSVVGQISYYVQFAHNPLAESHRPSPTYLTLGAITRSVLYLISAYVIARWLYPAKANSTGSPEAEVKSE